MDSNRDCLLALLFTGRLAAPFSATARQVVVASLTKGVRMTEVEIWSAIEIGEMTRLSLIQAIQKIKRAASLGWWDIFGGGGILFTFLKRRKMKEADVCLRQAKDGMERLRDMLKNFNAPSLMQSQTGAVLKFFDYVKGNIIADVLVQSRILQVRKSAEQALAELNIVLSYLHGEAQQYDV